MEPKTERERMKGMCVRGTDNTVRELGEGGRDRQRWSEEWEECWAIDDRGSEIREEDSRMVVRCGEK